jgi:DNA-binding GntR family transcriptional regulator
VEQLLDRLTDRDIDDLHRINVRLADNLDMDYASEIDFAFHVRLISILDNTAMLDVYQVMKPIILRIMKTGKTRRTFKIETYSEHEGVIEALHARDRLGFQYRLRNHLMTGFKYLSEEMEASA